MEKRKKQQLGLTKKLYRMQDDLTELKDYFEEGGADRRLLQRIQRMQFRVVYFIDRIQFD